MPRAYIYQYPLNTEELLYLPSHIPEFFDPEIKRSWPADAFVVPRNGPPAEVDEILRKHLNPDLYAHYCQDPQSKASLEYIGAGAGGPFPEGDEAQEAPGAPASRVRAASEALSASTEARPPEGEPSPDPGREREDGAAAARAARRKTLELEREKLNKITAELPEAPLATPPPPLPVALPASLAPRRALLLERGPDSRSPALPPAAQDGTRSFLVDQRFTGFNGDELNFLIWADQSTPRMESRRASWLLILTQSERDNAFRDCSGAERLRRQKKIVNWLREYYVYLLPQWLAAMAAAKLRNGETPAAAPGFELPSLDEDFSTRWEPSGRAALLLECAETQLNRICRNVLGQNAKELWDCVRIRHAGVDALYEYELRALRHKAYAGEEEDPGPDGTRKALKRARRETGRTRAAVAQRLGFLNHARLDRGFWNARSKTLSEFEAEVVVRLAAEGTFPEQAEAQLDAAARELPASTLGALHKEERAPASFKTRIGRTPCTDFKNLLRLDFAARARARWFARRKEKALDAAAEPPRAEKEGPDEAVNLARNAVNPARGTSLRSVVCHEGASSFVRRADAFTEDERRRLRWRFVDELSPAEKSWREFAQQLFDELESRVPGPAYALPNESVKLIGKKECENDLTSHTMCCNI